MPIKSRNIALIIFIFIFLVSCSRHRHEASVSFYYWQTVFPPTPTELCVADSLGAKRLYLRFFDVDFVGSPDQSVRPVGVLRGLPASDKANATTCPDSGSAQNDLRQEIVPVVYITQRALTHTPDQDIEKLALSIWNKVKSIRDSSLIREFQLDCDWSESTRSKYFQILNTIGKAAPALVLSSTIRLHQLKFVATCGVPPVARGTLMCYNADNPTLAGTSNSVFDENTVAKYIDYAADYPLPLDVALPLFSQAVVFRHSKALYLIANAERQEIDSSGMFHNVSANTYEAVQTGYFGGHYIYTGDSIRLEQPDLRAIARISARLSGKIKNKDLTITFFHLDDPIIERVNCDEIQTILGCYH